MASINANVTGIGFHPIQNKTKVELPKGVKAETVPNSPAQPLDGAAINFSAAPTTTPTAVPTPGETSAPPKQVESAFAKAATQSGVTLTDSGALAVLDGPAPTAAKEAPGKPFSLRNPDLAAIKVSPETASAQSMVFMNDPSEVKGYFQGLMGDKKVQLATAGYSAPPAGYEEPTTRFLSGLATELNGDVGFVTSPTADKGSIDAITSTVGQRAGAPIGYVTADSYLGYVNPDNFPQDIDKSKFAAQPKFAFPDAEVYSRGTAELSNSFLVTGGRNASVNDFKNAISTGNQVFILTNDEVKSPSWDPAKNRVDNASSYLQKMISGNTEGIPMDQGFNQDVQKFLSENREAIQKHVKFVDANDAGSVSQAAKHLKGE